MIFDKQTIDAVNRRFQFVCDGTEQDWPIEVSDKGRLPEFIAALKAGGLNDKEEIAIVALVIASYDDYLFFNEDKGNSMWEDIAAIISNQKDRYHELIEHWTARDDNAPENAFQVTLLMRKLVDRN